METITQTHTVFNQFEELQDYNLYDTDQVMKDYFKKNGLKEFDQELKKWGEILGTAEVYKDGALANTYTPVLQAFDTRGHRIDSVDFHPSWHRFMRYCKESGLIGLPFGGEQKGRWSYIAAYFILQTQVEAGALCPATMTLSCMPLIKDEPQLWAELGEKLNSFEYDARDLPISEKKSIWVGMGVTEKQGGTDVRQNATVATPVNVSGRGKEYSITGHKWFFSAPMCDAHLVVARTSDTDEICSFYVPRWKPDGTKNPLHIQRLKDKLGNRSNSSSEIEFNNAYGILIGEEGKGIRTIMEMANNTRFCCVIGSTGMMRQALVQAIAYTRQRKVFGKELYNQPLMRNLLVDMALEVEAAQALSFQLAEAFEKGDGHPKSLAWKRWVTPAAKYWVCKRTEAVTAEAMECFGGNGYIEDSVMTRLYKEAPVNSIWEGSGNVMCLDVLRVIKKSPELVQSVVSDLREMASDSKILLNEIADLEKFIQSDSDTREIYGRVITEKLILIIQACLLKERAPEFVSDAFFQLRIKSGVTAHFGTFQDDGNVDYDAILERAFPSK
ncbi:MAG: acyl-CoA dehydrogenase family protein [Chitinophagales bacterium]|nr:acyl-CoA dehydrogenase family protein [Chitinophagales bacterium]